MRGVDNSETAIATLSVSGDEIKSSKDVVPKTMLQKRTQMVQRAKIGKIVVKRCLAELEAFNFENSHDLTHHIEQLSMPVIVHRIVYNRKEKGKDRSFKESFKLVTLGISKEFTLKRRQKTYTFGIGLFLKSLTSRKQSAHLTRRFRTRTFKYKKLTTIRINTTI